MKRAVILLAFFSLALVAGYVSDVLIESWMIPSPVAAQLQVPTFAADPPTCNPALGLIYYNSTSVVYKYCSATNVWSVLSGPASNTTGIPAGNGNVFYASNFGVNADTYAVFDAVCTNGAAQVTSATAHFQTKAAIKVGQTMWTVAGGGIGNGPQSMAKTTIKSIDSDTQITANANGNANCGSGQVLVWGDDQTTALNTMWNNFVYNSTNCGKVHLPAGLIMISKGVMNTALPTICNAQVQDNSAAISGEGWQVSGFVPTPDFDLTSCSGAGIVDCIGPGNIELEDFQFNGFGLPLTTVSSTTATIFFANSPSMLRNIACFYFAFQDPNVTGLSYGGGGFTYPTNIQFAQCGAIGPITASGSGNGPVIGSYIVPGNGQSPTISNASPGLDFYSSFFGLSGVNECSIVINGFARIFGPLGNVTSSGTEACVQAGGNVRMTGVIAAHNQGIAGRAALKITGGGIVSASNSSFTDTGAGEFSISVDATSNFTDGCGNTFSGAINVTAGGKFTPCPGQIYPAGSVLQLAGITGTGACSTNSTVKGNIFSGQATCTGTSGAATFIITPGTTAVNGWRCTGSDITTIADTLNQSASGTTTCTLNSAAIASNDVIVFQAVPF